MATKNYTKAHGNTEKPLDARVARLESEMKILNQTVNALMEQLTTKKKKK